MKDFKADTYILFAFVEDAATLKIIFNKQNPSRLIAFK